MRPRATELTGAALLEQRIAEAEAALHRLMCGASVVEVRFESRYERFHEADIGKLQSYIADLKNQLAALNGTSAGRAFVPSLSRGLYE